MADNQEQNLTGTHDNFPQSRLMRATARTALACALGLSAMVAPGVALSAEAGPPSTSHGEDVVAKARAKVREREAADVASDATQALQTSGAAIAGAQAVVPDDTFYGPPTPKSRKGEIGNIEWTEPEAFVPPALEEAVNIVTEKYPSLSPVSAFGTDLRL
jgi:hypothetical protein